MWPKLLERHGAKPNQIRINDAAIRLVIDAYSREAGVRGLEKRLSALVRASILKMVEEDTKRVRIGKREVEEILGQARFKPERAQRGRGVVTGLAWTAMGGARACASCGPIQERRR